MAFFAPPPVHYSGDLGDVIHGLSKEGREEADLASQVKRKQSTWLLEEAGRMEGDPTKYLGAANPYDLQQRLPSFQAETGRMGATTDAGRLKFDETWAENKSAQGWDAADTASRNAATNERSATTAEKSQANQERLLTNQINMQPDESAQKWTKIGDDKAYHDRMATVAEESAKQDAEKTKVATEAGKQRAIEHLTQYMDPETAKVVAESMMSELMPGLDSKLEEQRMKNPAYAKLKADQMRKQNEHNAQGAADKAGQLKAADSVKDTTYGTGEELDRNAAKYAHSQAETERKAKIPALKQQLNQLEDRLNRKPTQLPDGRMYDATLDPKAKRETVLQRQALLDELQNLSAPLPFNDAAGAAPGVDNRSDDLFRAVGADASGTPQNQPFSPANEIGRQIEMLRQQGKPIPPELQQQFEMAVKGIQR